MNNCWKWRRRAAKNLPVLASRVFALRSRMYPGCGFHYSLERRLGLVLADLNNYDKRVTDSDNVMSELGLEELYRDVRRAKIGATT